LASRIAVNAEDLLSVDLSKFSTLVIGRGL
jgi:hypothetical protein